MFGTIRAATAATALAVGLAASSTSADAAFMFSGTFNKDNDVALFSFTLDSANDVTFSTTSFALGGFNPT